jgi:hypothetical protein
MTDFYKDIVASSGAYKYYVNGEWKESTSGKTVPILNPSTNQAVYQVQGETAALITRSCQLRICILKIVSGRLDDQKPEQLTFGHSPF